MRAVVLASVPTLLLVLGGFFACGGTAVTGDAGAHDANGGKDVVADGGLPDVAFDGPPTGDGGLSCSIMGSTPMTTFDPVAYCVLRGVLENQHTYAFSPKTGTLSSWDYQSLLHDPGGAPAHDLRNDASYASSLVDFYQWSQLYSDSPDFGADAGGASAELAVLAPLLEKELATLPLDYDGELYFNLRNYSLGLKLLSDNNDAAKIDKIAFDYARQIFTAYSFTLPLAGFGDAGGVEGGTKEGGTPEGGGAEASAEAGGAGDAGGDPGASGDGIIGVNQQPSTGSPGILYQPDKVASAAYALLDLANNNPADPDAARWVLAARRALDHVHDKARDPVSGLYHASLVTTGSSSDPLGSVTTPTSLLSSDVQATAILYLIRSYRLVAESTGALDAGLDATFSGVLASMGDFPFKARSDALIASMDVLWDGTSEGGAARGGYMDGLDPSAHDTITTKSTRPNAYMFAALHLQLVLEATAARVSKINALRLLLVDELPPGIDGGPIETGPSTGFFTVVSSQQGYFDTVSQSYMLLGTVMTPPQSYTAPAGAAVIAGFNEQLAGFHP